MSFVTNLGSFRSASSGFLGKDDSASGVVAGSYTSTNLTVDTAGRITAAANGSGGTVTSVGTGAGLSGGPITSTGTIALAVRNLVQTVKTDTFSTVSTSYTAVTGLAATITPSSATSKVMVTCMVNHSHRETFTGYVQLYRDATPICRGDAAGSRTRASAVCRTGVDGAGAAFTAAGIITSIVMFLDSPATTSATTYSIHALTSNAAQAMVINTCLDDADDTTHGRTASSITVEEILQ